MKALNTISLLFLPFALKAQKVNTLVSKGNEFYKTGDFKQAQTEYEKAIQKDQKNTTAQFNAGNALQKQGNFADASKMFQSVVENSTDASLQSKSSYNKGVAEVKQKQLQEAVNSFKESLRRNSVDEEARENLQKALNELKKQNKDKPKDDKQKKDKQQNKPQDKKEEKQKDNINKQQAENLLSQLRQQEKHLQELQKQKIKQQTPDKDW